MSSPVPPISLPDVELQVIRLLARYAPSGVTVATQYPTDYDGTQTFVRVSRVGGRGFVQALPWSDDASLDVEYHGPDQGSANDLMSVLRPIVAVAWLYQVAGGVFQDAAELVGPIWLEDPDYSKAGRYLVQNRITVHP
jgi:hypothetical protein